MDHDNTGKMSNMKPATKKVPVNFGADPDYLISGLTADVTALECVYDLIDNSIDAARNDLLKGNFPQLDEFGLPKSYTGYEIAIHVKTDLFSIEDNCSGIDPDALSKKSFRTGAKSSHPYGIGHFGVGLKRSIFKIGSETFLQADDGIYNLELTFTEQNVREAENKEVLATATPSKGKKMFRLVINGLRPEIVQDFKSVRWMDEMKKNLRIRYGRFIQKGLRLSVGNEQIDPFVRTIQQGRNFPPFSERKKLSNDVMFYLEAGLHSNYDPTPGAGASGKNKNLSSEYGWYVVCNDRIILAEDRTPTTGWGGWHPEYNGFVGWAHYISRDPSHLPWDSKKTGINVHAQAYTATIDLFSKATKSFRSLNRKRLKLNAQQKPRGGGGKSPSGGNAGRYPATSASRKVNSRPHTSEIDTVFLLCDVKSNLPKTGALVKEAANTPIRGAPYRAALMLRTLFEHVFREYVLRHKHFDQIRQDLVQLKEKKDGKPLDETERKKVRVEMDSMLTWVATHSEIWPEGPQRTTCKRACEKYKVHLKKLNGVVHEIGEIIEENKVFEIRNDVMSALVVMLEH